MALQNQKNWACSQKRTSESFNLFSYQLHSRAGRLGSGPNSQQHRCRAAERSCTICCAPAGTRIYKHWTSSTTQQQQQKKQEREDKDLNVTGQLVAQQQLGSF